MNFGFYFCIKWFYCIDKIIEPTKLVICNYICVLKYVKRFPFENLFVKVHTLSVKFLFIGELIISHNPLKINNSFKRINN